MTSQINLPEINRLSRAIGKRIAARPVPDYERLRDEIRAAAALLGHYQESTDLVERAALIALFLESVEYARGKARLWSLDATAGALCFACIEAEVGGEAYRRALAVLANNDLIKTARATSAL